MRPIRKLILTDEAKQPIAVQISYADWLEIEERLGLNPVSTEPAFDQLLKASRNIWTEGDGLVYQQRVREEWTRPWDPEAPEAS